MPGRRRCPVSIGVQHAGVPLIGQVGIALIAVLRQIIVGKSVVEHLLRRNVSIIVYSVLCFPLEDIVDIGLGAHNTLLVTGQGVVQLHLGTRVRLIDLGQKETVGTVISVACLVGAVFLIPVGQGRPLGGDISHPVIFRQDSHRHGGGLV